MRLQVQLVHAGAGVRVVLVSAWSGGECLGSALGEASGAEEAERRAEQRLRQRLSAEHRPPVDAPADRATATTAAESLIRHPAPLSPGSDPVSGLAPARPVPLPEPLPVPADVVPEQLSVLQSSTSSESDGSMTLPPSSLPASDQPLTADDRSSPSSALPATAASLPLEPSGEPNPDPEDWSDDLARIDLEVQRLGWNRSQEALYLERAFGHPSRSRLTRYGDLMAYLQALAVLEAGADPARVSLPLHRRDLLEQCDELLGRLGWDPDQGRLFLELNFQCSSRQHLSDQQLLQFNMLLEEQWLGQSSAATG